ncbi:dTDP-glucose 4,6-dehydratase [Planctomycetes bacterium Poly30]|uniref:dTDP-glucose 4,6-dehydratase n=1 Tax=Saltatorellus ferox TaxID=2528018 RepID=A0A518EY28_9BACT|nr:dTDP-glucose 4,6-dehydratase [Planctomycetes bacterium Poly30]
MSSVLVTGGTGCIGAVAVRDLLRGDVERVVIVTRSSDPGRLRLWMDEQGSGEQGRGELDPRIEFVAADVGDSAAVEALVQAQQPTHVVHLGALQSPDCARDPQLGMHINVGGTQALLEACERLAKPLERFVFASSAAVYGPRALYPGPVVRESDPLVPPNLYGVWKLAGEQLARLFHERTGVPTVCLRLNSTYGPGRDQGMTSAPTTAMKAIANGSVNGERVAFRMPYQGRENYHYVEDVGAHFARTALDPFSGFEAFNVRGETMEVSDFLREVERVAAGMGLGDFVDLGIADDASANLFVSDLDDTAIRERFPGVPKTALEDGIERSLRRFAELARGDS